MIDMFKTNDKILFFWEKFVKIISIFLIIGSFLAGMILLIIDSYYNLLLGLLLMLLGPFVLTMNWLLFNLIFSFLRDIKLIRNKLYKTTESVEKKTATVLSSRVQQLTQLLNDGIITQEEFDRERQKI